MQAVKVTVPALAEAMESLRANMIIFRYQIRYAVKNKNKGRKTLLAEKKATPFYQFVVHNDLAKQVAELEGP